MCGIAGIAGLDASEERATALVSAMCERMHHRGPDGGGIAAHPGATLGMKRLAIVDIEHGKQPMASDDGMIVLVYNGEVYNAPALRKELEARGVRFHTRSDTEVILRLYEQDPERVEEHLVGMWAFAIHDRRRRRLVLSRDRFGIKPLFVASAGRTIAFASELRCFDKSLPEIASCFTLDPAAAHAMIAWAYVPEDATIYRGVRRVPPATRLTIDLETGARSEDTYWTLAPNDEGARARSIDDACEIVEAALQRAVFEHLESDVPVATFLSGGIDSSLVTRYAALAGRMPVKAYSIGFREPRFDESPFARATAEKLGVPIEVTYLDEATARASLADALLAYDEPFGDSSSLATYLLSKVVAKDYKVALGGDGGDEVFAGYKKHRIVSLRAKLGAVPGLREGLGRALSHIPSRTDRSRGWTELLRTVRRAARGLEGDARESYVALTQVASLAKTAPLVDSPADRDRFEGPALRRFRDAIGTDLQKTLACDLANPLPNDMLVKVDRASMAHHLEARVPFLDHRVVELGVGLPAELTLGNNGKRVLRVLHERAFGHELANRKKQGFGVPVETWLRTSLEPACERLFDEKRLARTGVLSAKELGGGRYREWVKNDPQVFWHVFALAAWIEANHGDGPDALREVLG
ncbi:MAG: asparagine synthase (glutamine-hydrolyzing) [Deltaproteobacteria bacterium]|nr:asparagine synthase (glutamine-hydrolyzing) [Deltaproteobacteria bacterium]